MVISFSSGLLVSVVVFMARNKVHWVLKNGDDEQCSLEISGEQEDLVKVSNFINK